MPLAPPLGDPDRATGFSAGLVRPNGGVVAAAAQAGGVRVVAVGPDGRPDATFGTGGVQDVPVELTPFSSVRVLQVVARPDGRLVLAVTGQSPAARGHESVTLVGLTVTGAPDPAFHGGTPYETALAAAGRPLALTADGGLLVSGFTDPTPYTPPQDDRRWLVAKLLPDGSPDPAFGTRGVTVLPDPELRGLAVAETTDGRIDAIGGKAFGTGTQVLRRLTAAGEVDSGFAGGRAVPVGGPSGDLASLLERDGGRVDVLASGGRVLRLRPDGTPDPAFGQAGLGTVPRPAEPMPGVLLAGPDDQTVVVSGAIEFPTGLTAFRVARLAADGGVLSETALDLGFAGGFEDPTPSAVSELPRTGDPLRTSLAGVQAVGLRPDGGLALAGGVAAATAAHAGSATCSARRAPSRS